MNVDIQEYLNEKGASPFEVWFRKLRGANAAKITTALYRMSQGNFSNVKGVGAGVFEYKIDFGPGFRIYFGKAEERLVILLAGGTKKQQARDIQIAKKYWKNYKKVRVGEK